MDRGRIERFAEEVLWKMRVPMGSETEGKRNLDFLVNELVKFIEGSEVRHGRN